MLKFTQSHVGIHVSWVCGCVWDIGQSQLGLCIAFADQTTLSIPTLHSYVIGHTGEHLYEIQLHM